jgi:transposase InsO family protein
MVMSGTRANKLYRLAIRVDKQHGQVNLSISKKELVLEKSKLSKKRSSSTSTTTKQLELWHRHLGHAHNAMIMNMHTNGTVEGLHLTSHALPASPCEGCAIGKNTQKPFSKQSSTPRETQLGVFFYSDICGPMSQDSFGQSRYFLLFKDDYSGYRFVFCIKSKAEVLSCFQSLCSTVQQQTRNKVRRLRSDRGGEYTSAEFKTFLLDSGIRHELTSPHIPKQNGRGERENRTLVESTRSMLHSKKLSLGLWAEAIQTAAYVLNRTGSRIRGNKTPYELWTGVRPVIGHLRVFGSVAYAHVSKTLRKKLDLKSVKTVFVGYCNETKGYRLWDSKRRRIIISRDVIFDKFYTPSSPTPETFSGLFSYQAVGDANTSMAPHIGGPTSLHEGHGAPGNQVPLAHSTHDNDENLAHSTHDSDENLAHGYNGPSSTTGSPVTSGDCPSSALDLHVDL